MIACARNVLLRELRTQNALFRETRARSSVGTVGAVRFSVRAAPQNALFREPLSMECAFA